VLLERVDGPLRDARLRRNQSDLVSLGGEQLGEHPAHVVVVVVEEDDARTAWARAGHEIVGRQELHALEPERTRVPAADAVRAPPGTGGKRHVVEVVGEDLRRIEAAAQRQLDAGEAVELNLAVVEDANPRGEPGQACLDGPSTRGAHDVGDEENAQVAAETTARRASRRGKPGSRRCFRRRSRSERATGARRG